VGFRKDVLLRARRQITTKSQCRRNACSDQHWLHSQRHHHCEHTSTLLSRLDACQHLRYVNASVHSSSYISCHVTVDRTDPLVCRPRNLALELSIKPALPKISSHPNPLWLRHNRKREGLRCNAHADRRGVTNHSPAAAPHSVIWPYHTPDPKIPRIVLQERGLAGSARRQRPSTPPQLRPIHSHLTAACRCYRYPGHTVDADRLVRLTFTSLTHHKSGICATIMVIHAHC
jgi:hypothetical protein